MNAFGFQSKQQLQRDVKEIAAAASRVKHAHGGKLLLERGELAAGIRNTGRDSFHRVPDFFWRDWGRGGTRPSRKAGQASQDNRSSISRDRVFRHRRHFHCRGSTLLCTVETLSLEKFFTGNILTGMLSRKPAHTGRPGCGNGCCSIRDGSSWTGGVKRRDPAGRFSHHH